jgi:hypothetical protein
MQVDHIKFQYQGHQVDLLVKSAGVHVQIDGKAHYDWQYMIGAWATLRTAELVAKQAIDTP